MSNPVNLPSPLSPYMCFGLAVTVRAHTFPIAQALLMGRGVVEAFNSLNRRNQLGQHAPTILSTLNWVLVHPLAVEGLSSYVKQTLVSRCTEDDVALGFGINLSEARALIEAHQKL